ncbi:ABC transporter ATP-binding protein [Marinicellulosiphila megalodicopiae]|uniref:ABC transporter ATP-binding protein n=1 Tax=Marinicellulosiphila megalodicopiae TaxID=2724896 RepID=UPI003BB04DAA
MNKIKKSDWQILKIFWKFAAKYKIYIIVGLSSMPFSLAANLLFPWLIIKVIDTQLMTGQLENLPKMLIFMSGVLVMNYISDAVYSYSLRLVGQRSIFDIRQTLIARIIKLPRTYFDNTPTGMTLSRLTSDLESIGDSFVLGVLGIVKDTINTLGLIIFLYIINWQLATVILLLFPPILYITKYASQKLRGLYQTTRSSLARSTGYLQECIRGITTVQLYAAEKEVEDKYKHLTDEFLHAQVKANGWDAALFSVVAGITTIAMALIIWTGSNLVLSSAVSLGVVIAFINTLEKIFIPIREFTGQITDIQRSFAAFEHLDELFNEPLEDSDKTLYTDKELGDQLNHFKTIEFKDVSFRYKSSDPYVLKNVNFTLNKAQHLALVGTTGSGKSTIMRLLTKTYENYEGSILVNGLELSHIPKLKLAKLFTMMQQDVFLFEQNVSFNIGLTKVDQNSIIEAAKYVYAHEFIQSLPSGYDTQLTNAGDQLSAGQKQLISFARAMASGGQLMLLDEATSSIDSVTESLIQKALERVFQERTVIAIAHRLSTIRESDQILVLETGEIIERGNHDELVKMQGVYAGLLQEELD